MCQATLRVHTPNYHMAIKISQSEKRKNANLTYLITFAFHIIENSLRVDDAPAGSSSGKELMESFSQKISTKSRTSLQGVVGGTSSRESVERQNTVNVRDMPVENKSFGGHDNKKISWRKNE